MLRVITVARKPMAKQTLPKNIQHYGTGGLNIEGTRLPTEDNLDGGAYAARATDRYDGYDNWRFRRGLLGKFEQPRGRWPSNVVLQGGVGGPLSKFVFCIDSEE